MRSLAGKPNVTPPGGDYPFGRIKDNPGDGTGTPVNEVVYGDLHQFFSKLMDDAGFAPNGQPENSDDGFQLNEALEELIANALDLLETDLQDQIDEIVDQGAWINLVLINGAVNAGFQPPKYRVTHLNKLEITGKITAGGSGSHIFATIPTGLIPVLNGFDVAITNLSTNACSVLAILGDVVNPGDPGALMIRGCVNGEIYAFTVTVPLDGYH